MASPVELSTARLRLLGITPAIIHEWFHTRSKPEIMEYFGLDEPGFAQYTDMHEKGMETHRISLFFFLLIDRQTGATIGECGFHTWNPTHRRADLFYGLKDDSHKRKGLMTEALKPVLEYGFTHLNLHRVQALVDHANTPSGKLLLRYGFKKEGTMREDYVVNGVGEDSDCYSLLKTEAIG